MKIAIYGAGSCGCYLGGLLNLADNHVSLICRAPIKAAIEDAKGIRLTDYDGQDIRVMPSALLTQLDDSHYDIVLVTLKCHQLMSAIDDLATLAKRGATLLFMQNGLGSLDAIRQHLVADSTLQGIVPFNILSKGNAHFHRGTQGKLILQHHDTTVILRTQLDSLGFDCLLSYDMRPAIYGKLLMNLNNALNAIADIPLKTQLQDRRYRLILAAAMKEWLTIAKAQGVKLLPYTAVSPTLLPRLLALPNWLFARLASAMLAIDPEARSSMWEDLQEGRQTEISYLNGAVVSIAQQGQHTAPINEGICRLLAAKERGECVSTEDLFRLTQLN